MSVLVALQGGGAPEQHEVTFQVTGGGVVTAVTRKGAVSTVSITGGGIIAITARKGAQVAVSMTGGGVVTMSTRKGGSIIASITGGGVITPNFRKGGTVAPAVTGGGVISPALIHGGTFIFTVTGGGVITIESEAPTEEDAIIIVTEETDGAGPVAKRRRAGRTEFDEWTIPMDDEAIVQLYALRKTR